MIRKSIYIDNEQNRQIKLMAKMLDITESEVIRNSISFYMGVMLASDVTISPKIEGDVSAAKSWQEIVNWQLKQIRGSE